MVLEIPFLSKKAIATSRSTPEIPLTDLGSCKLMNCDPLSGALRFG